MATYNEYIEYLKHVDNTTREEIDKQIDALNKEISSLKSSLTTLQKEKDFLSSQFAKSQKDLVAKGDLLNVKGVEIDKLTKQQKELEQELSTLQRQKEDLMASLKQTEQSLQQKTKENEERGIEIESSKKLLEAASDREKASSSMHATIVSNLQKELDKLQCQLRDKDNFSLKQKQEQANLQSNLAKLQAQYNELLAKDNSSESTILSYIREITTLKNQLTQEREQVSQIKVQLEGVIKQNDLLNEKIKSGGNADAIKELQAELEKKIKALATAQASLSQGDDKMKKLQDSLSSKEDSIREYKQNLNTLQGEVETLKTRIKATKNKKTRNFLQGLACGLLALGLIWVLIPRSVDNTSHITEANYNEHTDIDSTNVSYDYVENTEIRPDYVYTGQRVSAEAHGIGVAFLRGSGEFEGAFKDGEFFYGKRTLGSGKIYIGPYVNNKANGVGSYCFEDGSRYIGEFKDDAMHGYGIYIDVSGHKSMGEFRNNEFVK